jgi:hypothetical protein
VYASEIGGTGAGEGGNDLSRATISSGTMTADRPNSWNLNMDMNMTSSQRRSRRRSERVLVGDGNLTDDLLLLDRSTEQQPHEPQGRKQGKQRSQSSEALRSAEDEEEGKGEEEEGKVMILPLNKTNLLSQMRLHVRSITRSSPLLLSRHNLSPSERPSPPQNCSVFSFFLSIQDCLGTLPPPLPPCSLT